MTVTITMNTTINTAQIISEKHHAKTTGCLFLLDKEEQLLEVYFTKGEITHLKAKNATGIKALKKLTSLHPTTSQFHDGIETSHQQNIPNTCDIIHSIQTTKNDGQPTVLPKHIMDKAKQLFAEYAGPIATIIFEEQIEKGTSLTHLITTLSSYIDDNDDRQAFLNSAKDISL